MVKYQTLHKRIVRGPSSRFSEKVLLRKAMKLYNKMIKKQIVKETAKRIGYISCRIDLTGSPEVSFTVAVKNGRIRFIPGKVVNTHMAIGMDKKFFVDLVDDPPRYGNTKIMLFNNIYLRKGRAQLFRFLKPLFVNALLSGK